MSNSFDDYSAAANSQSPPRQCDVETSEEPQDDHLSLTRNQHQHLAGLDALPTDEFLRIVGLRVRAQRSVLRMSRKRLSEVSGVSERYLAQLESGQGNISIVLLRKVTAAIGITLGSLLAAEILEISSGNLNKAHSEAVSPSSLLNSASSYSATGSSLNKPSTSVDMTPQRARLRVPEI